MEGANIAYYTPESLATKWGCSKFTVYELLRKGALRGFKLGRDWRITDDARIAYEQDPTNSTASVYNRKPAARKTDMRILHVDHGATVQAVEYPRNQKCSRGEVHKNYCAPR